nr:NAD(P)H-binding protein [Natrinema versiforme]
MTGATGTLGTALRSRLAATGHNVRAASREHPEESGEDIEWVELDFIDGGGVNSALADIDVVIHAATAPRRDTEGVDVRGTKPLLETAEEVDVTNFIYSSIVVLTILPSPTTNTNAPLRRQSKPVVYRRLSFVQRSSIRSLRNYSAMWQSFRYGLCQQRCRFSPSMSATLLMSLLITLRW